MSDTTPITDADAPEPTTTPEPMTLEELLMGRDAIVAVLQDLKARYYAKQAAEAEAA